MNWTPAEQIANALLYEGYLLYPYRPSSLKNRRRWTFGVISPPGFCLGEDAGDRFSSQTECLVQGDGGTRLSAKVRFLQELDSSVEEREITVEQLPLQSLLQRTEMRTLRFPPLEGELEIGALAVADGLFKVRLRVMNRTPFSSRDRDEALASSLLSCHTVLGVADGRFISLTDPPPVWAAHAERCENLGTWPVLVGSPEQPVLVLSSPIILPDYPAVAPESPGDLFDGTEIDELLSLRILTLTESEKDEIRRADARTRRLLDRTEGLSPEEMLVLHGKWNGGASTPFGPGQRIRLRPQGRADIFDLELRGKEATIVSIEADLEGRTYLAVTIDADPGQDLGRLGQPGHRFFFRPEDVEPL